MKMIHQLIVKYSKRYGINLGYFIKNGFLLLISQWIFSIRSLVIILLFTNFLGKEIYGQYNFIISVLGIISIFGLPWTYNTIIQSVARGYEGTYAFLLKKIFFFSLIGSVLLVLFAFWIFFLRGFSEYSIFIILAILLPFYTTSWTYIYFLSWLERFDLRVKYEIITHLIVIWVTITSVYFTKNLMILVTGILLSQILPWLYFQQKLIAGGNTKVDRESFDIGLRLTFFGFLSTVKIYVDKIIISYFFGFTQVAIYSLASAINEQIYAIGKIIGTIIMPKTSNYTKEDIQIHRKRLIIVIFCLFWSLSIGLILLYPYLIPFLFGESFYEAILYSQILTAFVSIKMVFFILNYIDLSKKDLQSTKFSTTISPIIEIWLMIGCGYYFWIFGIIWARVFGDILNLWYLFTKNSKGETK